MYSRNDKVPKPAVFRGEIDVKELPELREITLSSIQFSEFQFREPIKLDVDSDGGRVILKWRDANIEASGETLGGALDQLRRVVTARVNEPEIERFLKPTILGEIIRAFRPADG